MPFCLRKDSVCSPLDGGRRSVPISAADLKGEVNSNPRVLFAGKINFSFI
jgi:hypothetical protein